MQMIVVLDSAQTRAAVLRLFMIFAVASDGNRKLRALRIIVFVPQPYRQVENVWLGGYRAGASIWAKAFHVYSSGR